MFRFPLLPLLLIVGLVHSAWGAETHLPPEIVVLRAQPAVFLVKTVSGVELTTPQSSSANMPLLRSQCSLAARPTRQEADDDRAILDVDYRRCCEVPGCFAQVGGVEPVERNHRRRK